jgi:hypothetical protein
MSIFLCILYYINLISSIFGNKWGITLKMESDVRDTLIDLI